jgi:hypothetical protein
MEQVKFAIERGCYLEERRQRSRPEFNDQIDEEVLYWVSWIEDNERLSTRAAVEKKDAIQPNFQNNSFDAIDETHRKGIAQMNLRVKVIEKGSTFNTADPFYFAQCVAIESNIVAENISLSKNSKEK